MKHRARCPHCGKFTGRAILRKFSHLLRVMVRVMHHGHATYWKDPDWRNCKEGACPLAAELFQDLGLEEDEAYLSIIRRLNSVGK
jgi:hypothetical protein